MPLSAKARTAIADSFEWEHAGPVWKSSLYAALRRGWGRANKRREADGLEPWPRIRPLTISGNWLIREDLKITFPQLSPRGCHAEPSITDRTID